MRENYDFTRGARGKHARRYAKGANLVRLDTDVAKAFPSASSVNESLRALAAIIRGRKGPPALRQTAVTVGFQRVRTSGRAMQRQPD